MWSLVYFFVFFYFCVWYLTFFLTICRLILLSSYSLVYILHNNEQFEWVIGSISIVISVTVFTEK